MKKKRLFFAFIMLLIIKQALLLSSCDQSNPAIDDERIVGGWYIKTIIENGASTSPQDSIVYTFSAEGTMQIRTYRTLSASPPDQLYTFSLEDGVLRYWNSDFNVNEEKSIYFYDNYFRLNMYTNTSYNLYRIF